MTQQERLRADAAKMEACGAGNEARTMWKAASQLDLYEAALRFYAEQWDQEVDAERTVHGWTGTIGELCPTEALCKDAGSIARAALNSTDTGA